MFSKLFQKLFFKPDPVELLYSFPIKYKVRLVRDGDGPGYVISSAEMEARVSARTQKEAAYKLRARLKQEYTFQVMMYNANNNEVL